MTHLCGHGDVVAIGCNRSVSSALQLVKLLDFVLQTAWVMTHSPARAAEVTCCCRCTCSTWERCIASLAAASSISCCRCSWMLRSNLQLKISCLVKKAYEFRVSAEGSAPVVLDACGSIRGLQHLRGVIIHPKQESVHEKT